MSNYKTVAQMDDEIKKKPNSSYAQFLRAIRRTEPYDHNDCEKIEEIFESYLMMCEKYDMKVSNQAIAYAFGVTYKTLMSWAFDERARRSNPERARLVEGMMQTAAAYREMVANDGKVNPAIAIFQQKNYDGMRDNNEIVVRHEVEEVDVKALKEKYNALSENVIDVDAHIKESKTKVIDYTQSKAFSEEDKRRPRVVPERAKRIIREKEKIKKDSEDTFL